MYSPMSLANWLVLFSLLNLVTSHGNRYRVSPSISGAELNVGFGEEPLERDLSASTIEKRQACGVGIGSCPSGQCCSTGGQCGTGLGFCDGPNCQLAYGPACDGNISPPGASTLNIPRPQIGSVPYEGTSIYHCKTANTIALTFDDGPYIYTQSVLDTLAKYNNTQATFFINGNNLGKGRIDDLSTPWPQILQKMYNAGHQLASHTWTHEDLTQLPANLLQNQIIYNEMAFRNIFGFFPTYIRPPYGFCAGPSACSSYLNSLGYHIIIWDLDTKDYLNDDPTLIQISKNYFSGNVSNPAAGQSYIPLTHDIHQQTALVLVSYMLDTLQARGYKAVTLGECLGDPRENWYRDAGGVPSASSSAAPLTSSSIHSTLGGTTSSVSPAISSTASSSYTALGEAISSVSSAISTTAGSSYKALAVTVSSSKVPVNTISTVSRTGLLSATSPAVSAGLRCSVKGTAASLCGFLIAGSLAAGLSIWY